MKVLALLALLTLSCHGTSFDADLQPAAGRSDDVTVAAPEVTAEGLPPSTLDLTELFTLNPASDASSEEQINLAQNSTVPKTIVMATEKASEESPMIARNRTLQSKTITQTGGSGTTRTDTFERGINKGVLDLLLVIDTSALVVLGYQAPELAKYVPTKIEKIDDMLQHIDNSNWQINIIDTDNRQHQRCQHTIVTKNTKSLYETTLANLKTKSSRHFGERALQKAAAALGITNSCNYTWLRPNSTLAAIIINNHDHWCYGENPYICGTQVGDFITAFRALRPHTRLYGIFDTKTTCGTIRKLFKCGMQGHGCYIGGCTGQNDDYKLLSANYLAEQPRFDRVEYIHSSAAEYTGILQDISADIKGALQHKFTLTLVPDSGAAVTVTVNGTPTSNFQRTGKILTLTGTGNDNDKISVTYVPEGGVRPFISTFTIDSKADMATLKVYIKNTPLQKNTHYNVSGNRVTLTGKTETVFPTGAVALLTWHNKEQHDPKQSVFEFARKDEIIAGSVDIPGYAASRYTFDTNPNRVIFKHGQQPAYGAKFNIAYTYYTKDQLTYALNYRGKYTITAVDCSVSCSRNGGSIVFTQADFRRGRSVTVKLTVQGLKADRRPLPQHYVPDSLRLELGNKTCSKEQLVIANGELLLKTANAMDNGCALLADLDNNLNQVMTLSYLTFTPKQEVEVGIDKLVEYVGYSREYWEVFVDGTKKKEGTDYTIAGRKITFTGDYPPNTKGKVKIYLEF